MADRQEDVEETVTGPPVSAAFKPDGEPTPAASGFARKHGVEMPILEQTYQVLYEQKDCRLAVQELFQRSLKEELPV